MKNLATRSLLCILVLRAVTACVDSKEVARGAEYPSSYEGIWLAREILDYRQSQSSQFICDNIENNKFTGFKNELRIDGQVIDKLGNVYDFTMNEPDFKGRIAMWRILRDGSTVDNIAVLPQDKSQCADCSDLVALKVKKLDKETMANSWTLKDPSGTLYSSDVTYYRMSKTEMAEIRTIFNQCTLQRTQP